MSKKTDKTLNKCDELIERLQQLKKALNNEMVQAPSNRKPANGLGIGWSQDPSTGSFHHSMHGIISTSKHPDGYYQINHGGRSVGRAASPGDAGLKIKGYVGSLGSGDTGMHNIDPNKMSKEEMDKSGYGPKGGGQYTPADNVKRKQTNVGADRFGNQSTKSYTHNKAFDHKVPKGAAGPVKQYTPEQIAAINEARKLKKTAEGQPWVTHGSVPNADEELSKLKKSNPVDKAENLMANQLANLMQGRAMLGQSHKQPTSDDFVRAGEAMGLAPTEDQLQKAEAGWTNRMNWLEEAMKPIASRFNSPEEEAAYWDSIKVNGSSRDDHGF